MKKCPFQLLSLISLAALTFVAASAQQRFEGTGKGTVVETPGPFFGTPLLDGFFVRFGPPLGQPSRTDHHLKTLEVRAQRPEPSNVRVTYADKNADDAFAYIFSFHSRVATGLENGEIESVCVIQCSFWIDRPSSDHVFVLRGFKLSASHGDRHVERLAVFEADGFLTVAFEHERHWPLLSSGVFLFQVDYTYLPPAAVRDVGELWGMSLEGGVDRKNVPEGDSVLRGFDLRFTNGSHHVQGIGVQTPDDGSVEVFFNDKNSDDPFVWSVRWAILAPEIPVRADPRSAIPPQWTYRGAVQRAAWQALTKG